MRFSTFHHFWGPVHITKGLNSPVSWPLPGFPCVARASTTLRISTSKFPATRLTVITGLSGSGKSSLAFDTIYAEGQRRYVETLSAYARQFLDQMERPDVDSIDGLSPAISIEQKTTSRSPRSTVGTITEIYDYLRLLYSSIGMPHCPHCGQRNHAPDHRADRAARPGAEAGRAHHGPGADRPRPQRRVQEGDGKARPAGLRRAPASTASCDRSTKTSRSTSARITPSKSWSTACW